MKHTSLTSFSVACLFSEPTNNLYSTVPTHKIRYEKISQTGETYIDKLTYILWHLPAQMPLRLCSSGKRMDTRFLCEV